MKHILILFSAALVLASCSNKPSVDSASLEAILESGNLEELKKAKDAYIEKQQTITADIQKLDEAIAELDDTKKIALVTSLEVSKEVFHHYIELQGNVQTKQNVLIYPEMAGTLLKIYVTEGQAVGKGQLLASIDDGGLSQQVAQIEVQLALAKTTYERQERLWNENIGSEIEYLQAKSNYEAQERALNQLKIQLGKSQIRAPFSGIIDDVIKDQGTVVAPGVGSEVFRIINLNNMYIETDVPETHMKAVTKGKDVIVRLPFLGDSIATKIRQAGYYINPENRTFKIEVPIPNKDKTIKPNVTAKLLVNDYSNPDAILIPLSIISENAEGSQFVYVVNDKNEKNIGVAEKRIITTGKTQGDVVEVLSGLESGEEIINEGARAVRDQQEVNVDNQ